MASKEYNAQYYQANKDKLREQRRNPQRKAYDAAYWQNVSTERRLLRSVSARAKREGLPFDLTLEDIIIPQTCPVLGIVLDPNDRDARPEVDKKIPSLGYVKRNVCVISGRANRLKSNATIEELERVLDYLKG